MLPPAETRCSCTRSSRALIAAGTEPNDETACRVTHFGAENVARQLARRLSMLPKGADAFVRALAILGRGSPLRHLAPLAELDLEDAAIIADTLRAASILAPSLELDFAHPILRVAADETMGPDERALAHARAAKMLAEDGAPPDRLALHLLLPIPAATPRSSPSCVRRPQSLRVEALPRLPSLACGGRWTSRRRERYAGPCSSSSASRRWRPGATRSPSPSLGRRSR